AGFRTTPNGNRHARMYAFVIPFKCGPEARSFIVPRDDDTVYDYHFATVHDELWQSVVKDGSLFGISSGRNPIPGFPYSGDGSERTLENKYLIDRNIQKDGTVFAGIANVLAQDRMARQTSYTDRTKEHLGSLDRKIILVRRMLINAAKNLAKGIEPPALDPSLPYDKIGTPSKVLAPGEDWTILGSEKDPIFQRYAE